MLDDNFFWHLYIIEGDSKDDSWKFLQDWASQDDRVTVAQLNVGRATDKEALARNWSVVGNACFDLIPKESTHTHVLWLESDLCFPLDIARRLLAHDADIVAPVIFLGDAFYDTWGFRGEDGVRWSSYQPYHSDYRSFSLLPMQSVGSCVLFSRKVFDLGIRMRGTYDNGLLVGMCSDARRKGLKIWADTGTAILHPVDNWERQMWQATEVVTCINGTNLLIEPPQFYANGIGIRMAVLDPGQVLDVHRQFLQNQFQKLRTNHICIDVQVVNHNQRRYRMMISALEPTGFWAMPIMRNHVSLLSRLASKIFKSWEKLRIGSQARRSYISCICTIQIHSDLN